MPRPTSSTTIQRPDLGALAYEYAMEASQRGFIADLVLPVFDTQEKTADYPIIPAEAVLKLPHNIKRAPKSGYAREDFSFETGTFACEEFGFEAVIDESEANLYRRYFDAEVVGMKRAMNVILRSREKRAADLLFNATTFAGKTTAVVNEWNKPNDATPRTDVNAAKKLIRQRTGLEANAITMSRSVFDAVLMAGEFLTHIEKTRAVLLDNFEVQKQLVAQFFGVESLFVGNAVYDSAKKNKDLSAADIWDDEYVLVGVFAKSPRDLSEPCVGRSFLWLPDSPDIITTETYRDESKRSDIVRVRHNMDEVTVFTGAGQLLSNISV